MIFSLLRCPDGLCIHLPRLLSQVATNAERRRVPTFGESRATSAVRTVVRHGRDSRSLLYYLNIPDERCGTYAVQGLSNVKRD